MKYCVEGENIDIKKMFEKDSRDKKRTGCGVYKRASRRGYVKGVKLPIDNLKGKAKKEYMNNGEVKVSNIYEKIENIPNKDYFKNLDKEKGFRILTEIKKHHKCRDIVKQMGYSSSGSLYALYKRFGMETNTRSKSENKKENELLKGEEFNIMSGELIATEQITAKEIAINNIEQQVDINSEEENTFYIKFNGEYGREKIENKIMNILSTLDEDGVYKIKLEVTEK